MQIEQCLRAGDLVVVRQRRWRVVDVRTYDGCQAVTLYGVGPPEGGGERHLLAPFDRIEKVQTSPTPHHVRRGRWRRACRALLAANTPPGSLRSAAPAAIDLLPYQLEPAMAVVRGIGCRLLLADEVGLGKTIQTGLIVSELTKRGSVDRVLVVSPAGLRDQWVEELAERFAIRAASVDGPMLRRRATELPIGMNPWATVNVAVASIDYLKRAEVLPAAAACSWQLVIIDEAHAVAGDSDRHAAVQALTCRAAYVLMLTATPHNGDRQAFTALCALGAVDDTPLLVFRRTRRDVGIGTRRRVHALHVRLGAPELRMHALLARYTDAVRAEAKRDLRSNAWLALSVLHKRALSSPWALAQSVQRRLGGLTSRVDPTDASTEQLVLPLGDPDGEMVAADEPPLWPADLRLSDTARERRLLERLEAVARTASRDDRKLRALARLLRRGTESAVVFTEYRDTLVHVRDYLAARTKLPHRVLLLHGGLTRDERVAVLAAFAGAGNALLLATDAAAEGLNLHRTCRLVVTLELPWNPMRLEQRIGRVDRIGQRRTVHAFHLIAAATGEVRILVRLRARLAVARTELGAPDPLGEEDEREVARLVMKGDDGDADGGLAR
jgi:SNF2 family DNA or RNA helicase